MKTNNSRARRYAKALAWYRDHPIKFVEDVIGAEPDEFQRDALRAHQEHDQIAISGCTGSGKDTLLAWMINHAEATELCKGLATAPTKSLLDDVLWSEVHKWLRMS